MKLESLLPLIGLVLGWLLNELSQSLRVSREQKPALSTAINTLIDLGFILKQRRSYLGSVSKAGRLSDDGRRLLRGMLEEKKLTGDILSNKLSKAVQELIKVDPLTAHEIDIITDCALDTVVRNYERMESFDLTLKDIDDEIRTLDIYIKTIEIHTLRLVRRYNVFFCLRFKRVLKREARSQNDVFEEAFKTI